jgi:hypothetical protein
MIEASLIDQRNFKTPDGARGKVIGQVEPGFYLVQFEPDGTKQLLAIEDLTVMRFDPPAAPIKTTR